MMPVREKTFLMLISNECVLVCSIIQIFAAKVSCVCEFNVRVVIFFFPLAKIANISLRQAKPGQNYFPQPRGRKKIIRQSLR